MLGVRRCHLVSIALLALATTAGAQSSDNSGPRTDLALQDAIARALAAELATVGDPADLATERTDKIRDRLFPALHTYLTGERREDGLPLDPVARFHLGNGAAAWRLNWPANNSPQAWQQSYGAMVNYRYEPAQLEQRHEAFVRRRSFAVTGPLQRLADTRPDPVH